MNSVSKPGHFSANEQRLLSTDKASVCHTLASKIKNINKMALSRQDNKIEKH